MLFGIFVFFIPLTPFIPQRGHAVTLVLHKGHPWILAHHGPCAPRENHQAPTCSDSPHFPTYASGSPLGQSWDSIFIQA